MSEPDLCSICIEKLNDDDFTLNCSHKIHSGCLLLLLLANNESKFLCPLCRCHIDLCKSIDKKMYIDILKTEKKEQQRQQEESIASVNASSFGSNFTNDPYTFQPVEILSTRKKFMIAFCSIFTIVIVVTTSVIYTNM